MGVNFDLNDLQAFRAVVELGSFRRAAEAVSISQPALSRRIDKLEDALGVRLFERTTRSVTLTTVGRVFAPSAEQLLDDLDVALLGIRDVSTSRLGHVTIACVPSVAYYFLPSVIADLSQPAIRGSGSSCSTRAPMKCSARSSAARPISASASWAAKKPRSSSRSWCRNGSSPRAAAIIPLLARKRVTWNELYEHEYVSVDKTSGNRLLLDQALTTVAPSEA